MAHQLPPQSSFLYSSNWTPALDSLLMGIMIRLKSENNWDGGTYPNYFILEAQSVIQHELGLSFDWAALYDRLHFLEKRCKTFNEVLQRNPLAGAYLKHGDLAYRMLADLFAHNVVKVEQEKTVIVLSDTPDSVNNDFVFSKFNRYGHDIDNDSEPGDHVRRKLVFDEGYPPDMLSTNNKAPIYYVVGEDGKMSKKVENERDNGSGSSQMKSRIPPKVPTYSSDSNSPIIWWRMPRKPQI
ncbi:hypothetical protein SASPL_105485 [Salvia splendens]|uniref:Uncharacterized protein n=1 Tax=Salvia splendens TaxID=180675 RepID=A0A8X8YK13_SALSN|nr:hypothetical protein SASPL_105485 [Salvia splendens]